MDISEFCELKTLTDFIALRQQQFLEKIEDFDIRDNTFGNAVCWSAGQTDYDEQQNKFYVLSQLFLENADSYGLRNILCPIRNIYPNNGTKTQQYLQVIVYDPEVTLYAKLPEDDINNHLCQYQDIDTGIIYQIKETITLTQGTYTLLFECTEIGNYKSALYKINKPVYNYGNIAANNIIPPLSIGTPVETDYELRVKNDKIGSPFLSENFLQSLKAKLLNINCRNVLVVISTEANRLQTLYNIPLGALYVVCRTGEMEDIFKVLFDNCLGWQTYGIQEKTKYECGFPYEKHFDYSTGTDLYMSFTLKVKTNIVADINTYLTTLKGHITDYFTENFSNEIFATIDVSQMSMAINNGINKIGISYIFSDDILLGTNINEINKQVINPTQLNQSFNLLANNIFITVEYF